MQNTYLLHFQMLCSVQRKSEGKVWFSRVRSVVKGAGNNIAWRKEKDGRRKNKRGRRQDRREEEMEKWIRRGKDKAASTDGAKWITVTNKQDIMLLYNPVSYKFLTLIFQQQLQFARNSLKMFSLGSPASLDCPNTCRLVNLHLLIASRCDCECE